MADEDELEVIGYKWEGQYERTWEVLREDAEGSIQESVSDIVNRAKRRRLLERPTNVRLGMMRHLYVVLDMSSAMTDQDLRPNRQLCTLKIMEKFIEDYFDQNPISQLGMVTTKDKLATKLTELAGNPRMHITAVQNARELNCSGEPSLMNSLELCMRTLRHVPAHTSREILVISGSLTSCDPGDIYTTIKALKDYSIRCSVIGLGAEIRVCDKLCKATNGKYDVVLDETHYKDLLLQHCNPPPCTVNTESALIRMGFPYHQLSTSGDMPSMCMCHLDSSSSQGFGTKGYFCPQCKSKYCELPVECKACGLTLVSAPHLARSYHHLFPLDISKEVALAKLPPGVTNCYACQTYFTEALVYLCEKCHQYFCLDCDLFVHETLHSCPGCANKPDGQDLSNDT